MLERGHIATMYHRGTDSYAEVVVLRMLSKADVAAENEAASGNVPAAKRILKDEATLIKARGDAGGVRRALADVLGVDRALDVLIYNDVSKDKTTRRLKCHHTTLTPAQNVVFGRALRTEFGDRLLDYDHTPVSTERYGPAGDELFVRLKVAK